MSHEPPKLDPRADCTHTAMRRDPDLWRCPCGVTIEPQDNPTAYLAAMRAALRTETRP